MKKLNLGNINAGLSTIKELANENAGIARDELIDVSLIDFATKTHTPQTTRMTASAT